ncbi:uncharacterized protein LOC124167500 [Ischnura elegans]|uniref:uncharacterized protein LOC124167500 n=1 Tax=Ischnura elegans TaxID=197161 RepID=UPI001ED8A907|nr:uncharacterized protein LOC124167500 [Ischnura elegans]
MLGDIDDIGSVPKSLLHRSVVKLTGRTSVQLLDEIEVQRATEGVEGFTSIVLKVRVPYRFDDQEETRWVTFFVKRLPVDEYQLGLVVPAQFFLREGTYMEKFLPEMIDVSQGKVAVPIPVCYAATYGGLDDAIVLQDLGIEGYRTPSRNYQSSGLDLEHCEVAMEALGRLHALSIAAEKAMLSRTNQGWLDAFPVFSRDSLWYEPKADDPKPFFEDYMKGMSSTILTLAKEIDGLPTDPTTMETLEKVLRGMVPTLCHLLKPNPGGRNVVSHGDCWLSNMMFRYEKDEIGVERPTDAKLVDFQITRYCHPCVDLIYFLSLSTSKSLRGKHLDKLISDYYKSTVDCLNTLGLGSPPWSLDEFKEDFFGPYLMYGVILRTMFFPMLLLGDDFTPSDAECFSREKLLEFVQTGNANTILNRFRNDTNFRRQISDVVIDFVSVALSGPISLAEVNNN